MLPDTKAAGPEVDFEVGSLAPPDARDASADAPGATPDTGLRDLGRGSDADTSRIDARPTNTDVPTRVGDALAVDTHLEPDTFGRGCTIDGGLVPQGALDPNDPCLACLPNLRDDSYSPRPGGTVACPPKGCGLVADGCGGLTSCGDCTAPETCGGGGVKGECGCTPVTCTDLAPRCGTIDDGCGGKLDCGDCAAPNHCGPMNVCGLADNIIIYSNYEGGKFTIEVDQDVPNLAIGIVSYEDSVVTITGPYAANVVAVSYAGYGAPGTSVTGVDPSRVTIATGPKVAGPGPGFILCGYGSAADTDISRSGCNTRDQVRKYFTNQFSAPIRVEKCQYEAFRGTLKVSEGGTCNCTPPTCAALRVECGTVPDGCGGNLQCDCPSPQTCGGNGVPNVCGGCAPGQILSEPRRTSSFTNDKSIGRYPWAKAWDAEEYETDHLISGNISNYLRADFGSFRLPENAVIGGIYVQWKRKGSSEDDLQDNAVRIVKGGAIQSTDRSASEAWTDSYRIKQYGGATDLWGTSWTAKDINTSLGAVLSVKYTSTAGNDAAHVSEAAAQVCYQ